jgi:signal transduction histidine kinase
MLIIAWRNLESINHYYISTFFLISWTKSKIFLSAGIFITYTFFIRYFFGAGTPVLKKIAHFTLLVCCAAMIMEVILLQINWYWSWLLYYWFRIAASLFSLVFLFIIWKSPHPLAKFVFSGSLCLIVAEIISWFVPTAITSEVAWAGVVLEFIFFSYAMGMRTQLERQEKLRLAFANELLTVEKALETERLRTRIAQDIHDEVGASLTKIALTAQVAERITRGDENITRQHLRRISEHARLAAGQLRDIVFGINPDYDSFSEMLTYFQERIHHFWEDQSLQYHIDFPSTENNPTVSPKVKRQLLLILKEAMTNISRHADASEVHIRLVLKNADNYLLEIRDNGQGFSPGSAHHFSNGLSGMQKRADAIQAKLWIDTAPGEGCRITIEGQLDAV